VVIGRRVLTKAGYHFVAASTGAEALRQLPNLHPDLILLDYTIPDMDGYEFLSALRTQEAYRAWQDIPVIVLTARAEPFEKRDRLFEIGLKAFLVKPFGHRELLNVIESVLRVHELQKRQPPTPVGLSSETLGQLAGGLRSIISLSRSLLEQPAGSFNEEQRTSLLAIYNSGRSLLKRIQG